MSGKDPEPIDFLILTVLDKEFDAVLRHVTVEPEMQTGDTYAFYKGTLDTESLHGVGKYTIVVVQSNDMGNVAMASVVTTALERYSPRATIVVGIAGGVKGEIMLGDVAVSRAILPYERGKRYGSRFISRAKVRFADSQLVNHARVFARKSWHTQITEMRPDSMEAPIEPDVKFGTIASGEKVISDALSVARLKKLEKDLIAIEMEGSGAIEAVQAQGGGAGGFLDIRGISDYADKEKADGWQAYAADAAAAFTFAFLASKPIFSQHDLQQRARSAQRPFIAIRAQSMARINPAGPRLALGSYGATEVDDVAIDLMPFAEIGGRLTNVDGAVRTLIDPAGAFLQAADRVEVAELAFTGHMHIPLAVLAGAVLSDRVPVKLLDFHSADGSNTWTWPADDASAFPTFEVARAINEGGPHIAFLRVSLSYPISDEQTDDISARPYYEIDVRLKPPALGIVRSEAQARSCAAVVRAILDEFAKSNPRPSEIHLFYAGPVSVAFAIGQKYSPSIHPRVIVWNYRDGKYDWNIDLKKALDTGE